VKSQRWILAAGLVLGMLVGLAYAWLISPVEYSGTTPACLPPAGKQDMISLIASAYAATGDLEQAAVRLARLDLPDIPSALEAYNAPETGDESIRSQAVQRLALALFPAPTPTALNVILSDNPAPESMYLARTEQPGMNVVTQQRLCDPAADVPQIRFRISDYDGNPLPGIRIQVSWDSGYNRLYTGFKPEAGSGYADFSMNEGEVYSVRIDGLAEQINDLAIEDCYNETGQRYPGSLLLALEQVAP